MKTTSPSHIYYFYRKEVKYMENMVREITEKSMYMNPYIIIRMVQEEKYSGNEKHKKLWFLEDCPDPVMWLFKAIITADNYGYYASSYDSILDFYSDLKDQMKYDREHRVLLW